MLCEEDKYPEGTMTEKTIKSFHSSFMNVSFTLRQIRIHGNLNPLWVIGVRHLLHINLSGFFLIE